MLTTFLDLTCNGCLILVNEILSPDLIPFVWFGGIAITVYVFFHKFSDVIKEKFRQTNLTRRAVEKGGNTDGQIDYLISNAPRILNEINKQIAEQKAAGVTDEQLKSLYQKKQMLELVTNNQEIINIVGKPIIKKLLGFVRAI
jgi:coenzyme F420-reducing hydrogenase alpha subunit